MSIWKWQAPFNQRRKTFFLDGGYGMGIIPSTGQGGGK